MANSYKGGVNFDDVMADNDIVSQYFGENQLPHARRKFNQLTMGTLI